MREPVRPCDKKIAFRFLGQDIVKCLTVLPGLIWFRTKIVYENDTARKRIRGGALVIANHSGFFDPVYLQFGIWYRRHHFVCIKKFFEGKLWWLFKLFLCIPIDKNNMNVQSFKDIVAHLKAGELVTMFPEGKVNDGSGEMASFKSGMVLMALQSKRPIVPVYIHRRKNPLHRLVICIGEPIDPAALCGEKPNMKQINEAAELLKNKETTLARLK